VLRSLGTPGLELHDAERFVGATDGSTKTSQAWYSAEQIAVGNLAGEWTCRVTARGPRAAELTVGGAPADDHA